MKKCFRGEVCPLGFRSSVIAAALGVSLIAGGLALCAPAGAWADEGSDAPAVQVNDGFQSDGTYLKDGKKLTGLNNIDGSYYYFDTSTGVKETSAAKTVGSKRFYFGSDGKSATGWQKVSGALHFFNASGAVSAGYKSYSGKKCYLDGSGKALSGIHKVGGKQYGFDGKGSLYKGAKKVSGKYYYFKKSNGVMQKNVIEGSYYYGKDGVRCTSSSIKYAVKFVNKHTKKSWSKIKKLKACYYAFGTGYKSGFTKAFPSKGQLAGFAAYSLKTGRGNCYRFAAGFAAIARVIGYDSGVGIGYCKGHAGKAPHGWTLVKIGGKYCAYDPDARIEVNYGFRKNAAGHPWKYLKAKKKCYLNVKSGKVAW